MHRITVLVRTHNSNSVDGLTRSIQSLLEQTDPPEEVCILEDGSVTGELYEVTREYERSEDTVSVLRVEDSVSRGEILRQGVAAAETELLAILDCGDISVENRFRIQRDFLARRPEIDVVGGYVAEFESDPETTCGVRTVPTNPEAVRTFAKSRAPVNQPTVCFRRDAVLDVGNYRSLRRLEDYDLWVRMLNDGKRLANVNRVLSKVEIDSEFYKRRGGVKYLAEEVELYWHFYKIGYISLFRFALNVGLRAPVRLLPGAGRKFVYRKVLRR